MNPSPWGIADTIWETRREWAPILFNKRIRPRAYFQAAKGRMPGLDITATFFLPDRMATTIGPQFKILIWKYWFSAGFQVCWVNAWGNLL